MRVPLSHFLLAADYRRPNRDPLDALGRNPGEILPEGLSLSGVW
jgi:hypothetical protein